MIEVQSGSPQTGAPSGRLDDYFEVKVTDGRRRPVSGMPVTFTESDPNSPTTASMFIPVPGTKIYADGTYRESAVNRRGGARHNRSDRHPFAASETHGPNRSEWRGKNLLSTQCNPGAHTVTATAYGIGITMQH